MIPPRRAAIWVLFLGANLALNLIAQDPAPSKLQSNPAPVPSTVVQLLAVGPGSHGKNQDCAATGFIINEEGYILTNFHVIEKSEECLADTPGAKIVAKFAASVLAAQPASGKHDASRSAEMTAPGVELEEFGRDEIHDLAILRPERPLSTSGASRVIPFVLLDAAQVSIPMGAAVKVTGHPASTWDALTLSGKIIGHKSVPLYPRSDELTDMIVLDIPLKHGSSGSPVYLEAGSAVVGVVEQQNTPDKSQSLAVPIQHAIEFLNQRGVKWHAAAD
ncbi:MAG TPA: serine protease [Terriglobia bacterium]|nr:serine protease [Terriglobia bacterium]